MRSPIVLMLLVSLLLVAGAGRLVHIQTTRGDALRQLARRQQTAELKLPAARGTILDARGRILAGTTRRPSIYLDALRNDDPGFPAYAAHSLAPVLGLRPADLEKLIRDAAERDARFVWIKREISNAELSAFEAVRRARKLNSFDVAREPHRIYPFGRLASHVLGFVSADRIQEGLSGVEQAYDQVLTGKDGFRRSTVDARRRRLKGRLDDYEPPVDGGTVILTVDAEIQRAVEKHLQAAVSEFKAQWGAAVVMDVKTGEVLAMAVAPDFDPADPIPANTPPEQEERLRERLRNRAIADAYEPGSIFKPFIASLALETNVTSLERVYAVNGPTRLFGSRTIRDTHPYGSLTLRDVISKSSNIGMGLLGASLGNARLNEFVRRFGFGDPTGIGLPGEHDGLVQDFSRWGPFSTQSIPIGQEIAVTPIQLVTAFAALCNDGILYRPRIVRGIVAGDGSVLEDCSRPIPLRRVLDAAVAKRFRDEALAEVVRGGTGTRAAIPNYQVFGKTGTAQIARGGRAGYVSGAYVGSFLGGAPLGDPRLAVIVSIYHPTGGQYYGGTVAAPTVGRILADALEYLRVPPEPEAVRAGAAAGRTRGGGDD